MKATFVMCDRCGNLLVHGGKKITVQVQDDEVKEMLLCPACAEECEETLKRFTRARDSQRDLSYKSIIAYIQQKASIYSD